MRDCFREEEHWYNYLEDPGEVTEVTEERREGEGHTDHNYHLRKQPPTAGVRKIDVRDI